MNTATATCSMLDAALAYAGRRWPVFPVHSIRDGRCTCGCADCDSPGKHPRTAHGHTEGTTSEEQIRAWWGQWPDANVGIVTGEASGLVVLDVDLPGGDVSLEALEDTHGALPETLEATTGGGRTDKDSPVRHGDEDNRDGGTR